MTKDDEILAVLNRILDAQRQALANQEKAIASQQVAIERQAAHLRLYKLSLFILAPIIAALILIFLRVAGPYWSLL